MKYPVLGFIAFAGFLYHLYLSLNAFSAYQDVSREMKGNPFGNIGIRLVEMRFESVATTTVVFLLLAAVFFGLDKKSA